MRRDVNVRFMLILKDVKGSNRKLTYDLRRRVIDFVVKKFNVELVKLDSSVYISKPVKYSKVLRISRVVREKFPSVKIALVKLLSPRVTVNLVSEDVEVEGEDLYRATIMVGSSGRVMLGIYGDDRKKFLEKFKGKKVITFKVVGCE